MFTPDSPITSVDEDDLNRSHFAQQLAQTILDWDRPESMVIALFGPWGSGKTSIMNMVVDFVAKLDFGQRKREEPIILKFNPWFFSGQSELLTMFLIQLLSVIEDTDAKRGRHLREQFKKYSAIVSAASNVPVVGSIAAVAGQAMHTFGAGQDLNQLRDDINKAFNELGRQVIILIDDIDRLTQDEIRYIFRLIKLNADFPNTVYIIAADRKVLVNSLESEQGVSGQAYLEKIVQVGFDIPLTEASRVTDILKQAIGENLGLPDPDLWDQERWARLFHAGFKRLFTTLRAGKRYVNSLAFNYKIVAGEVNPVDFIGIEAIRVFESDVYAAISNNKALLCSGNLGTDDPTQLGLFPRQLSDQELRGYCDGIFKCATDGNVTKIQQLCLELFPAIRRAYNGTYTGPYEGPESLRRKRRICSPDVFSSYFVLGTPQGEVSRAELLNLKNSLETVSPEAVIELVGGYIADGRIRRLLELSGDIQGELSVDGAKAFATALIRVGESIPDDKGGPFSEPTDWLVVRCLWWSLEKLDMDKRADWFRSSIADEGKIYYLVSLIYLQRKDGKGPLKDDALLDDQNTTVFEMLCVERLRSLAVANTLLKAKDPRFLLLCWQKWEIDKTQIRAYVSLQLVNTTGLFEFLSLYLENRYAGVGQNPKYIRTNELAQLIELPEIDTAMSDKASGESALTEEQQVVFDAWKRSYRPQELTGEEG